jgi:hypothetical protein
MGCSFSLYAVEESRKQTTTTVVSGWHPVGVRGVDLPDHSEGDAQQAGSEAEGEKGLAPGVRAAESPQHVPDDDERHGDRSERERPLLPRHEHDSVSQRA